MVKAVCLFSGGLDSILAYELVRRQDIDVIPVWIDNCFEHLSVERTMRGKDHAWIAAKFKRQYGIDVTVLDVCDEFFRIMNDPPRGFGKNLNPCIDCKILMMKRAKSFMYEQKADFLISGEVMGQRPMSQTKNSLVQIEKAAGVNGILLRPLCAKNLEPVLPEKKGLVDRQRLKGFSGRTRTPQIALAEEFGITEYPNPAGGCLLTEENYTRRLRNLMDMGIPFERHIPAIVSAGRHFALTGSSLLVCGRVQRENGFLERFSDRYPVFIPQEVPGPSGILLGRRDGSLHDLCCGIITRYIPKRTGPVTFLIRTPEGNETRLSSDASDERTVAGFLV
jgi:tRNA U34 2-thiouridine synthase MnmA/TrmU